MAYVRPLVLASVPVALCACTGLPGTAARDSPTPTIHSSTTPSPVPKPLAFPSPSPGGPAPPHPARLSCRAAVIPTANLTLVTLKDDAGVKVRDISDLSNPRSLCSLNGQAANYFRF